MKQLNKNQQGFTIIELMIATAVFSTILIIITVMMINIGNLYYKGINQSRAQDNVRSISEDIAQRIQVGGTVINFLPDIAGDKAGALCVGNVQYSYILDRKNTTDASGVLTTRHVLWRSIMQTTVLVPQCAPLTIANLDSFNPTPTDGDAKELIGTNTRLTDLSVGSTSPYNISVAVAYGDADLLKGYDPTGGGSYPGGLRQATRCKGGSGQTYCATAFLETAVGPRLKGIE